LYLRFGDGAPAAVVVGLIDDDGALRPHRLVVAAPPPASAAKVAFFRVWEPGFLRCQPLDHGACNPRQSGGSAGTWVISRQYNLYEGSVWGSPSTRGGVLPLWAGAAGPVPPRSSPANHRAVVGSSRGRENCARWSGARPLGIVAARIYFPTAAVAARHGSGRGRVS